MADAKDEPKQASSALRDPRGAHAQTRDELIPLVRHKPKQVAGGVGAIRESMVHALGEAGPIRGTRLLLALNQFNGFDCPGCAWPDPDGERSVTEFCENGAKAIAEEGTKKRVDRAFFEKYSVAELSSNSDYWLGKQGRLTEPMALHPGETHYKPISWDDAFKLLARELNSLGSPDEALFYTSGRASNEAAFLYQLFARQFGTNNLPDCSNMCHESSGSALVPTIGIGKGTVKLDDFEKAELIICVGQNPGTNHPRMLTSLQAASKKGAIIVGVNPLRETGLLRFQHPQHPWEFLGPGTELAKFYYQVHIGGDGALFQGINKYLFEQEERAPGSAIDEAFIDAKTEGFAEHKAATVARDWDTLCAQSGLSKEEIVELGGLVAKHKKIIICWAMGITQTTHAVAIIQEIVNTLLMRGAIGKEGAGPCPVRGHSNVQGDRTMGIWEKMPDKFMENLGQAFDFKPPGRHGYDVVDGLRAMHQGKVRAFVALGGNIISAASDTEFIAAAMRTCSLTAHVSTKLNRSHLVAGQTALILPCLGRSEADLQARGQQFVTTENSMGVVQKSQGHVPPASKDLLSEPKIIARLAQATLGARTKVPWAALSDDYDRIRSAVEKVIPGFENYNERVRKHGGFYLPNGPREGIFTTPSQKAHFTVHDIPPAKLLPGQLLMASIRSHDQYNTTIYGLKDRYRGLKNSRRVILMNASDIAAMGFKDGSPVDISSHFNGETRTAGHFTIVAYNIPKGCAATYYPETNVLVALDSVAKLSNTPTSKSIIISLKPAAGSAPFPDKLYAEHAEVSPGAD